MNTIYTIGYTAFRIDDFINILMKYNITCVIDVRSLPYSQYYPDYNKEIFEKTLKSNRKGNLFLEVPIGNKALGNWPEKSKPRCFGMGL